MPKVGRLGKIASATIVLLAFIAVGGLLFPVPAPELHLPANYEDPFFELGPIYVTNTLLTSWLSIVVLVGLFYAATRKMKLVPSGLQNAVEAAIEMLLNFVQSVAGKENGRRFFPVIATIFLFVLMNAWLSLFPGFSVIGFGESGEYDTLFFGRHSGFIVNTPLLRAANTDINIPLMLALMSFLFVEYWGISSLGLLRYGGKFIRIGQLLPCLRELARGRPRAALSGLFSGLIDIFVGTLEIISEFVRLISFTFRLFGNMTAGEVLLLMMAFIVPWLVAVPFYGLEMILGFVQALIFGGLTLVFATVAVTPHGGEHE